MSTEAPQGDDRGSRRRSAGGRTTRLREDRRSVPMWLRGLIAHMRQIEKACKGRQGHHAPFPIPRSARADVSWWRSLMPRWNGHSIIHQERWERSDKIHLTTDACGTGFGAMFGNAWFAGAWSPEQLAAAHRNSHFSMPFLELHALVQAADGACLDEDSVRAFLLDRIEAYKVPRTVEFVDTALRDDAGKARRLAVRDAVIRRRQAPACP